MIKIKNPVHAGYMDRAHLNNEAGMKYLYHRGISLVTQGISEKKLRCELSLLLLLLSRHEDRLIGADDPEAHREVDCILYLKEKMRGR